MKAKERDEIAQMVNSIIVARDMERKQRSGVKMAADWGAALDDAIKELGARFPLPPLGNK